MDVALCCRVDLATLAANRSIVVIPNRRCRVGRRLAKQCFQDLSRSRRGIARGGDTAGGRIIARRLSRFGRRRNGRMPAVLVQQVRVQFGFKNLVLSRRRAADTANTGHGVAPFFCKRGKKTAGTVPWVVPAGLQRLNRRFAPVAGMLSPGGIVCETPARCVRAAKGERIRTLPRAPLRPIFLGRSSSPTVLISRRCRRPDKTKMSPRRRRSWFSIAARRHLEAGESLRGGASFCTASLICNWTGPWLTIDTSIRDFCRC